MAENTSNTTKTPIETNSDLIAEVQSLVDNLPEAGGGGGTSADGWTKIGELTMGGTVFPITAYADGIITVTPQDGVYPTVQQNRILRKPDYSAYENVQLVATETAGQYSMKNLDGQTYAPSGKDFTQYVLEEPEAMLLTFTNTPAFAYHKARFTAPLMPCHGMHGSFASTYSGLYVYDAYVYNMGAQSGCEIWLENDATYDTSKICVRASYFSGKGGAGDHNQVRIVNKPTIPTSIGFRNESAVLAINSKVELWGRN